jgi:Asp-tRNA(Asn)/Glu-tRNA(Gln) amidotransferase A subunit family amidase
MLQVSLDVCLKRIREKEPEIQAWVEVQPLSPLGEGPLFGMPFGVKDIFDVAGLRCEWGSPIHAGRVPTADSALVRRLRELGGICVGKTHTTTFAYFDAAPTRNPYRLTHTPGGSSSGSAAAVACGMVPVALGSQTQGSMLRPASFCGVVGFKPTIGLLPLDGVMPFAPTLDTAGLFTANAADMADLWRRMGYPAAATAGGAVRLAAFRPPPEVEAPMRAKFLEIVARLGVPLVDAPPAYAGLYPAVKLTQEVEGGRTLEETYRRHGAAVGVKLAQLIEHGLATPKAEYEAALAALAEARREFATQVFTQFDFILTPAALGPAPETLSSTGDPRMNSPWTGLGTPAVSLPMPVAPGDLPLGLQVASAQGRDAELLAWAASTAEPILRAGGSR